MKRILWIILAIISVFSLVAPNGLQSIGRDSCGSEGSDPIENFMDYSDNSCSFKFTEGQSARMETMAAQYRGN